MTSRLGLFGGIGLATLGVGGLAAGGIAWNFQGCPLGLGATVASLVLMGISLVILWPQPTEPVLEPVGFNEATDGGINLRLPQISILGALLASFGTFGLAASGIAWNFKGLALGLTGTLTSLLALAFSVVFLWPVGGKKVIKPAATPVKTVATVEPATSTDRPQLTTAEAMRQELAEPRPKLPLLLSAPLPPTICFPARASAAATARQGHQWVVTAAWRKICSATESQSEPTGDARG